jgi:CMP-N,N'-diacetyllegionaminic acid synthase
LLGGQPLINYSIRAACESTMLSECIVSTDDAEIRRVAIEAGGNAPFLRPAEISGDEVRNAEVLIHALEWFARERGVKFDYVILLQPTSPLRSSTHIDEAITSLIDSNHPTLASVTGPHKKRHPFIKRPLGDDAAEDFSGLSHEPVYLYNASIYGVETDYLLREKTIFSNPQAIYRMPEYLIDIDDEEDLRVAELLLCGMGNN